MKFIQEFKKFAIKGNVVDLAVAVVLGAAFGRIITALTDAFIMPLVSLITGRGGVGNLKVSVGRTVFPYGTMLQAVIDFILIALVLFLIVRAMNLIQHRKEAEAAPANTPPELSLTEKLLTEIRDGLKNKPQ